MSSMAAQAFWDQQRAAIADGIRRHGCWITYVGDDVECACCTHTGLSNSTPTASKNPTPSLA